MGGMLAGDAGDDSAVTPVADEVNVESRLVSLLLLRAVVAVDLSLSLVGGGLTGDTTEVIVSAMFTANDYQSRSIDACFVIVLRVAG